MNHGKYRRKCYKEGEATEVSRERTKKMDISDKCLESDLQFGYTVVIFKTFCHLERHLNDNFVGCREVLVSG